MCVSPPLAEVQLYGTSNVAIKICKQSLISIRVKGLSHEVETYGTQSECRARASVTQEKHIIGLSLRMFFGGGKSTIRAFLNPAH